MRIFARRQDQPQKPGPSLFNRSNTAILGPNPHLNPLLHWQRAMGDQAAERPLQPSDEELRTGLNGMPSPFFGHDFSRIPIDPPGATTRMIRASHRSGEEGSIANDCRSGFQMRVSQLSATSAPNTANSKTTNAVIQRKPRDLSKPTDRLSGKEGNKKAELEFRSTIAFIGANSSSSSTGPSKEGFGALQIKWAVWNTGWEAAPVHVDRMTIYNADRCSGCRDEKDEMLKAEVEAPATIPITQPGDDTYKYESISPMVAMTIRAGHYDVYVDLDVYDEVEEINEDNNTIFTSFYVKPRDKSDPDTEGEE
jgi:hypothetical protein